MGVKHNTKQNIFHKRTDVGIVELKYQVDEENDVIDFISTFTPEAIRGEGHADEVVQAGFEYADENNYEVQPTCVYISDTWLDRHPDWEDIVVEE